MRVLAPMMIAMLLAAGCAAQFERPDADAFGEPPRGYEDAIRAYFETTLKDPESARYKFGEPFKAHGNSGWMRGGGVTWVGYAVDVDVNAKNSFGGYTGYQRYIVAFTGEQIYRVVRADDPVASLLHRY
jgi:hypothetical protein